MISTRNCISRNCSSTCRWHERVNFLLGCRTNGSSASPRPWPGCKTFPVVYVALTKFHRRSKESVTTVRLSDAPFRVNLQISRFFHLMRIGDEIGSFPSPGRSQTHKNSHDRLREPGVSE